jgi:serine/threonine-protein phosphatase 2A regulatory subunit B
MLTSISFDTTGEYLAVGDKGGRVIIFRYVELKNSRYFDFRYFAEFQSHEPQFDHLKSIEVNERINSLAFIHNTGSGSLRLISTNDKVIKLWKIDNRTYRQTTSARVQGN